MSDCNLCDGTLLATRSTSVTAPARAAGTELARCQST